jgi:hypothetical protein
MTDDELTRRLEETLRAKAAQVPEQTGAFDTAQVTELGAGPARPTRGAWRYALASAALIALVVGVTTVVLAAGSDDSTKPAAPGPSTTIAAPTTVAPSTTTAPTTTTVPVATTTTPPTTIVPAADEKAIPVDGFNQYIENLPDPSKDATDARDLALIFTNNKPPPSEPQNAVRVEEHSLPNDRHKVTVFVKLADDSIAEVRYRLEFAPQPDGSWRLASAFQSHRCQLNRGHQDFTTEVCI